MDARLVATLRSSLLDALALLVPVNCAGCGAEDRALCLRCRAQLRPTLHIQQLPSGLHTVSALRYEESVQGSILALKERGRTDIVGALAVPLLAALSAAVASTPLQGGVPVELALVPSSRRSYRRRGYDPVRLLLRRGGVRLQRAVVANIHQRDIQKSLGREARASNLAGTMRAKGDVAGRRFVIVDDVVTTGVTIMETERALRDAGAEVCGAATLAFTPRYLDGKWPGSLGI